MTQEQFKNLKRGDIVSSRSTGLSFVVTGGNNGERITVVRTQEITNPGEWNLITEKGTVDSPPPLLPSRIDPLLNIRQKFSFNPNPEQVRDMSYMGSDNDMISKYVRKLATIEARKSGMIGETDNLPLDTIYTYSPFNDMIGSLKITVYYNE